jgi:hypothetical protein
MVTRRNRVRDPLYVRRRDLEPIDAGAVHDDEQDTDHLRLADQNPLARARLIEALERAGTE